MFFKDILQTKLKDTLKEIYPEFSETEVISIKINVLTAKGKLNNKDIILNEHFISKIKSLAKGIVYLEIISDKDFQVNGYFQDNKKRKLI